MGKNRTGEALEYMRSAQFMCGPAKIALKSDMLHVAQLPSSSGAKYQKVLRRAVEQVLAGAEGMLLLTDRRSHPEHFDHAARLLTYEGWDTEWEILKDNGETDSRSQNSLHQRWRALEHQPDQRVELPIYVTKTNETTCDSLLVTGALRAYPETHPRYFPMDVLIGTRMEAIRAIAASTHKRIVAAAGKRAGAPYGTSSFLPPPTQPESR